MVRVKICGITNLEDAEAAVRYGATALGFVFAPSPRRISPEKARQIVNELPPFIQTVGVFVDEDLATVRNIAGHCRLNLTQLHGEESPDYCHQLMPYAIKVVRMKDAGSVSRIRAYRGRVRAILSDTYVKDTMGGTGKCFDWGLAVEAQEFGIPLILSGGLNPQNIENAILKVRPYAVDVSSSVEEYPGKKSGVLMEKFMDAIRRAEIGRPQ